MLGRVAGSAKLIDLKAFGFLWCVFQAFGLAGSRLLGFRPFAPPGFRLLRVGVWGLDHEVEGLGARST